MAKRLERSITNPLVEGEPAKVYPKAVRGGSWMDTPNRRLRSAARTALLEKMEECETRKFRKSKWWHTDAPFVGFRIVRPLETPTEEEQKKYWKYELTD
jgi:hypothetical protein